MITFQRLRDVVLLQDDVKDLLVTVQKYAYLVQGNWTVKRCARGPPPRLHETPTQPDCFSVPSARDNTSPG